MTQVISVHSFRGGTGKSNITANLAVLCTLVGKRVGIIDTDIQSPGIHVLFGLDQASMTRTLNDYLQDRCQIADAIYDVSYVLPRPQTSTILPGQLYLMPSSIKTGEIASILREGYNVDRLNDGLDKLGEVLNLDYLFIDTHPGLNEETLLSIALTDTLVVILRPDRQDFQGTAVTIDIARKLEVPKLLLVVNKVLLKLDPEAIRQKIAGIYGEKVVGVLPLAEEMIELASEGLFALRYPTHPLTQQLVAIARELIE